MILAAGEGTRLRPLTLERPKPMLPVAGRPVLEHIVAWLRSYGITRIAMNLHHLPHVVTEYFGDGSAFQVELTYSVEESILGTAGGVRRLAPFFDEPFVLVYGDVLTDLDLKTLVDFHHSQPAGPRLTMSLYCVANPTECGIVGLDGESRIVRFVEKPSGDAVFSKLASAGVVVVDAEVVAEIPEGVVCDFGRDLFPLLLAKGYPLYGWPLPDDAYLIDIGSPEKYAQVQREWPTLAARRFCDGGQR
jgi:NDP-sugar pyrophosphorylase family protein